jgi:hypothetical protein
MRKRRFDHVGVIFSKDLAKVGAGKSMKVMT